MVGSTGTLMTMRLVRSKLRKREESSTTLTTVSPTTIDAQQSSFALHSQTNSVHTTIFSNNSPSNGGCNLQHQDQQVFVTTTTTSLVESNGVVTNCTDSNSGSSGPEQLQVTFTRTSGTAPNSWVFPPKAPTPNIYNCLNNDTLLITNEKTGLKGLGFRKQFSGRFKRLVSKKQEPIQAIPPELKPQLKTIYVY